MKNTAKLISKERKLSCEEEGSRQLQAMEIHLLYQNYMVSPRRYASLAIVAAA